MKTLTVWVAAALAAGCVLTGCDSDSSGSASASTSTQVVTVTSSAPSTSTSTAPATVTETVAVTSSGAAPAPGGSPASSCGSLTAAEAYAQNVAKLPAPGVGTWMSQATDTEGYDPCADLSYLFVDIQGGTASSPRQLMFFHKGEYLGTASKKPFSFSADVQRHGPGALQVTFKYLGQGDANANPTGRAVSTFTWDDAQQKVVHAGEFPPDVL